MEVVMFSSVKTLAVILAIAALFVGSCQNGEDVSDPAIGEEVDDDYEIEVVALDEGYLKDEIETRYSYPVFGSVIVEKGYRVNIRDAAFFKVHDKNNGKISNITMIPCTNSGHDNSVAMIYYIESGGEYIVTAAEYFKEEDFGISHPLDTEAYEKMMCGEPDESRMIQLAAQNVSAQTYWGCVTKYSVATCIGCMVKCYLSGPGWTVCTTTCCSIGTIVSMISCLFTVYGM